MVRPLCAPLGLFCLTDKFHQNYSRYDYFFALGNRQYGKQRQKKHSMIKFAIGSKPHPRRHNQNEILVSF